MLQLIKKIFNPSRTNGDKSQKKIDGVKHNFGKNFDGAKQLREMGKLGGKLILM